jgi:hypothetical protein
MAARILVEFTVPLIDAEIEITVGAVAGSVIGGLVGGVLIVGVDLGIDAIEGAIMREKLRDGIKQVFPLRAGIKLSQNKATTLLNSLNAVKTTLDAMSGAGVAVNEKIINELIRRDINPSIEIEQAITAGTVAAELKEMDRKNNSWTNEDPS